MSELKPCDFLGNEIFIGDEVAFFALGYRMFTRGTVVKITNKCVFIDYDNSWNYDHHEEHTRQEQRQVIDLTALNRRARPAVDPVRHGRWERIDSKMYDAGDWWWDKAFKCSCCGDKQTYGESDYCPNCGAKMDAPKEEN